MGRFGPGRRRQARSFENPLGQYLVAAGGHGGGIGAGVGDAETGEDRGRERRVEAPAPQRFDQVEDHVGIFARDQGFHLGFVGNEDAADGLVPAPLQRRFDGRYLAQRILIVGWSVRRDVGVENQDPHECALLSCHPGRRRVTPRRGLPARDVASRTNS